VGDHLGIPPVVCFGLFDDDLDNKLRPINQLYLSYLERRATNDMGKPATRLLQSRINRSVWCL
jgi:hypothetical protein